MLVVQQQNQYLTAVRNKIPDASSLVKKTNYEQEISELQKKLTDHNRDKYITTRDLNTLAADVSNARLAQANLITKQRQILMLNFQVMIEKLLEINKNTYLLKLS